MSDHPSLIIPGKVLERLGQTEGVLFLGFDAEDADEDHGWTVGLTAGNSPDPHLALGFGGTIVTAFGKMMEGLNLDGE